MMENVSHDLNKKKAPIDMNRIDRQWKTKPKKKPTLCQLF